VDRKEKKEARQAAKKESGKGDGKPDIKRDAALEEMRVAAWPPEVRAKWEEYRRVYDTRKAEREAAAEAAARQEAGKQ
jgi:hypothetical protein